jgi:hypothetical protein
MQAYEPTMGYSILGSTDQQQSLTDRTEASRVLNKYTPDTGSHTPDDVVKFC